VTISIDATYENGILRPAEPLPLREHEKVRLTIEPEISCAERTSGMLKWRGDAATFDRLLRESEEKTYGRLFSVSSVNRCPGESSSAALRAPRTIPRPPRSWDKTS
jgi:predicted DNA-binding antitoxin AbrB/MazE fold protein